MSGNFHEMVQRAKERYDAMSPERQEAMWRAQRESWVRAFTTPCEHGQLDWETCPECRRPAPIEDGEAR